MKTVSRLFSVFIVCLSWFISIQPIQAHSISDVISAETEVSTDVANQNGSYTYTIKVKNISSNTIEGLTITNNVSSDLSIEAATVDLGELSQSGQLVTVTLDTLGSSKTLQITLTVKVKSTSTLGNTIANITTVKLSGYTGSVTSKAKELTIAAESGDSDSIKVDSVISGFESPSDPNDSNITDSNLNPTLTEGESQTVTDWKADVNQSQADYSTSILRLVFMLLGLFLIGVSAFFLVIFFLGRLLSFSTVKLFTFNKVTYHIAFSDDYEHLSTDTITYWTPNFLLKTSIFLLIIGSLIIAGALFSVIQNIILLFYRVLEFLQERL